MASTEDGQANSRNKDVQTLPKKVGPTDFERIKLIGQGDVGKVYLVRLKNSKHLFAMKVLSKQEMIARNKLKRCLTEREILATVDYPFIVTLYYCFQSPDHLFLVMDYCAGGEFFRMLKSQPERRIPEDWVRFYAAEVLLALEYLHTCGFIYRDLKPENILLHDSGHIMLTDFDLSKQASITAPVVKSSFISGLFGFDRTKSTGQIMIDTNSFVGTEEYIAPEVIKGSGQSSAVDWWTFGILTYEMAYGFTPFKGDTQHSTFSNICATDKVNIPDKPEMTSAFKKMIRGLLHRDPAKRLGSKQGASELKKCEFLQDVRWASIRKETPPFIPQVVDPFEIKQSSSLRDTPDAALDACLSWAPEIQPAKSKPKASSSAAAAADKPAHKEPAPAETAAASKPADAEEEAAGKETVEAPSTEMKALSTSDKVEEENNDGKEGAESS